MERLLHYAWKYRLYDSSSLIITDGIPFQVLDPGIPNNHAGPDFFNAKIKVGDMVWAGSIEIHDKASDWARHHHNTDKAYDSVILHVVAEDDAVVRRTTGEIVPQMILPVPPSVKENMEWLLHRETDIPCLPRIKEIENLHLAGWLDVLLSERLERKMNDIFSLLEQYREDWNEVFYIILTRNFGFGVNGDPFERLAKSLPFTYIRKHRNSQTQVEALLFGQAGMLEHPDTCPYYCLLQREYTFLRHKFDLKPLEVSLFKKLRVRPGNFPHLRLAQLAAIWTFHGTFFSRILETSGPAQLKTLFRVPPSGYWENHYHFRETSLSQEKHLGDDTLNILLINTVAPLLFAYGKRREQPEFCERAICLLETLPAEKNSIIHTFQKAGVAINHAGDSQAIIQLKRAYCEQGKCLFCRIGFRSLRRNKGNKQ